MVEFFQQNIFLFALAVSSGGMLLWTTFKGHGDGLSPAAATLKINRENALVIDLSPPADYEKGHVPGAKNVAMAQFDPEHKDLVPVRELPVAITCRSGVTAEQAAKRLVKAGFQRVYVLGGGNAAWTQADLPLAKGRG